MVLLGSDLVQQTPLHAAHVLYGLPQPKHGLSLAAADLLKKFRKVFPFPGTPEHLVNTERFTKELADQSEESINYINYIDQVKSGVPGLTCSETLNRNTMRRMRNRFPDDDHMTLQIGTWNRCGQHCRS